MNILDLLHHDSIKPKKASGTHGGEYASACPACGGKDRFRCWPEQGTGGKWWCRQCDKGGDLIQYLKEFREMKYKDACLFVGIEPLQERTLSWDRKPRSEWQPRPAVEPSELWVEKASKLVARAESHLWEAAGSEALEWLMSERGISAESIQRFRLGWVPESFYRKREDWGLKQVLKADGKEKKLWIPQGLLIPYFVSGKIQKIKIRRPEPDADPRYYLLPGSSMRAMIAGEQTEYACVVESELDMVLICQEAGDLVSSIALGSAKYRPDMDAVNVLQGCKRILNALDYDQAGGMESWTWWADRFSHAVRWTPVGGKDPGAMRAAGVDVRAWIEAGLPANNHKQSPIEVATELRDRSASELIRMYGIIGETYGTEEAQILDSLLGWSEQLGELEAFFTTAWMGGRECGAEFDALRAHWRSGIKLTREKKGECE